MTSSRIFGYFRNLGFAAVRSGKDTFTFEPTMYGETTRQGFSTRDELETFCWLSGATFWAEPKSMSVTVRVPKHLFWEYWTEKLSESTGRMERY